MLSVSYPPGENALTWQVFTPRAGSARVRISYIIGQLDKSFAYRAIAANDEKTLTLWQYLQLHNNSNEEFATASISSSFPRMQTVEESQTGAMAAAARLRVG